MLTQMEDMQKLSFQMTGKKMHQEEILQLIQYMQTKKEIYLIHLMEKKI